jgi:hypothetical protein
MESASYFAKKHGLEKYLDKPDELNELILKLMVLQETLQAEGARKNRAGEQGREAILVRRTAAGKFTARCSGDAAYRYAVTTALQGSTALVPIFQRGRFISLLKKMGVPEERIAEYSSTMVVDDDTLCIDQE